MQRCTAAVAEEEEEEGEEKPASDRYAAAASADHLSGRWCCCVVVVISMIIYNAKSGVSITLRSPALTALPAAASGAPCKRQDRSRSTPNPLTHTRQVQTTKQATRAAMPPSCCNHGDDATAGSVRQARQWDNALSTSSLPLHHFPAAVPGSQAM
eukprot:jgi/Chlat1/7270/Chrsp58S06913